MGRKIRGACFRIDLEQHVWSVSCQSSLSGTHWIALSIRFSISFSSSHLDRLKCFLQIKIITIDSNRDNLKRNGTFTFQDLQADAYNLDQRQTVHAFFFNPFFFLPIYTWIYIIAREIDKCKLNNTNRETEARHVKYSHRNSCQAKIDGSTRKLIERSDEINFISRQPLIYAAGSLYTDDLHISNDDCPAKVDIERVGCCAFQLEWRIRGWFAIQWILLSGERDEYLPSSLNWLLNYCANCDLIFWTEV